MPPPPALAAVLPERVELLTVVKLLTSEKIPPPALVAVLPAMVELLTVSLPTLLMAPPKIPAVLPERVE